MLRSLLLDRKEDYQISLILFHQSTCHDNFDKSGKTGPKNREKVEFPFNLIDIFSLHPEWRHMFGRASEQM